MGERAVSPGGYFGRALVVDASERSGRAARAARARAARLHRRRGARHLADAPAGPPGVDPLAPEAPLAFVFSPLVGTPLTTSAKFAVVAKSPLTDLLNDALASSHFAIAGKLTGYDAIVVRGAAPSRRCWSSTTPARASSPPATCGACRPRTAEERLRERLGAGVARSRRSGPAGENLVRYATVSHDGRHAGRGGLGAVLGAKNIKAVAVRGAGASAPLADPPAVLGGARDLRERSFGPATAKYRELGTLANLLTFNALSHPADAQLQRRTFEGAGRLAAEELAELRSVARDNCASCTIGCEHIYASRAEERAAGVRERVRARPAVRRRRPDAVLAPAARATSSASTRSPPAARSRGRWSAPSAA